MLKRFHIIFFIALFCFFSIALAQKNIKRKVIMLGVLFNLSGDQAPLGKASLKGTKLAVDEINQKGGIKKYKLLLQVKNGRSNLNVLKREAKQFAQENNIQIVMGLNDDDTVLSVAPTIAAAKKVFVTSGATLSKIPKKLSKYLFLVAFGDNAQAAAAAEFIYNKLKIKSVALVYDKSMGYTEALSSYFTAAFVKAGGTISMVESFKHNEFGNDIIKSLKSKPPQLIYLAAGPTEAPLIIKQLRENGIKSIVMGGDSYMADDIIKASQNHANDIYFTTHDYFNYKSNNPAMQAFVKSYQKKYNAMPKNVFAALGYDTVNLIAYALNKAKNFSAKAFIK